MSENTKEKKDQETEAAETELTDEELEGASGGASAMLAGRALKPGTGNVALGGGSGSFASTSGTTLCDWHNCTQNISGC